MKKIIPPGVRPLKPEEMETVSFQKPAEDMEKGFAKKIDEALRKKKKKSTS